MAEEPQGTQAADAQPDPQPQPAATPEAGAQAAPAEQPKAPEARFTLPDGTVQHFDGEGNLVDEAGAPVAEQAAEPAAEEPEQPAAEAQADGTPDAPVEDPVKVAERELEQAKRKLAQAQHMSVAAGQTWVPPAPEMPKVELGEVDMSDYPALPPGTSDEEAGKIVRAWVEAKVKSAAEGHATKLMEAHHNTLRQQAMAAQQQAQQEAQQQRFQQTHAEALRRTGLSPEDYQARLMEVQRNCVPAWYSGQAQSTLPVNYASNMMDDAIRTNHALGIPTDGYDTSADLLTEVVNEPAFAKAITDAFPRTPEGQKVLTALTEGANFIGRMRALTGTDEGRAAMGKMLSVPAGNIEFGSPAWSRYSEYVRAMAARFDGATNTPPRQAPAANATNTPAQVPAGTPTGAPPAVTPDMRQGAVQPTRGPIDMSDPGAWEKQALADIEEQRVANGGTIPLVIR